MSLFLPIKRFSSSSNQMPWRIKTMSYIFREKEIWTRREENLETGWFYYGVASLRVRGGQGHTILR